MNRLLIAAALGLGITMIGVPFVLARTVAAPASQVAPPVPVGDEQPIPGQIFINGHNIPATAPCNFADIYAGAHELLGPPIASFTGRSQDFLFARLECSPLDPTKPPVYANIGLEYLRDSGRLPESDAEPHPLVRQYFEDSQTTGLDPAFYGRILSKAVLVHDNLYEQYTDRALLLIDTKAKDVSWAPLGCWLNQACARFQRDAEAPPVNQSWPTLLWVTAGAFLVLVGLAASVQQLRSGRSGRRFYG